MPSDLAVRYSRAIARRAHVESTDSTTVWLCQTTVRHKSDVYMSSLWLDHIRAFGSNKNKDKPPLRRIFDSTIVRRSRTDYSPAKPDTTRRSPEGRGPRAEADISQPTNQPTVNFPGRPDPVTLTNRRSEGTERRRTGTKKFSWNMSDVPPKPCLGFGWNGQWSAFRTGFETNEACQVLRREIPPPTGIALRKAAECLWISIHDPIRCGTSPTDASLKFTWKGTGRACRNFTDLVTLPGQPHSAERAPASEADVPDVLDEIVLNTLIDGGFGNPESARGKRTWARL